MRATNDGSRVALCGVVRWFGSMIFRLDHNFVLFLLFSCKMNGTNSYKLCYIILYHDYWKLYGIFVVDEFKKKNSWNLVNGDDSVAIGAVVVH